MAGPQPSLLVEVVSVSSGGKLEDIANLSVVAEAPTVEVRSPLAPEDIEISELAPDGDLGPLGDDLLNLPFTEGPIAPDGDLRFLSGRKVRRWRRLGSTALPQKIDIHSEDHPPGGRLSVVPNEEDEPKLIADGKIVKLARVNRDVGAQLLFGGSLGSSHKGASGHPESRRREEQKRGDGDKEKFSNPDFVSTDYVELGSVVGMFVVRESGLYRGILGWERVSSRDCGRGREGLLLLLGAAP